MHLEIDAGGPEPAEIAEPVSGCTYNLGPMFRAAGFDYREMDGRKAGECIDAMRRSLADMVARPDHFKQLDPPNGWGDYDGAVRVLGDLLKACEAHPLATLRGSF